MKITVTAKDKVDFDEYTFWLYELELWCANKATPLFAAHQASLYINILRKELANPEDTSSYRFMLWCYMRKLRAYGYPIPDRIVGMSPRVLRELIE